MEKKTKEKSESKKANKENRIATQGNNDTRKKNKASKYKRNSTKDKNETETLQKNKEQEKEMQEKSTVEKRKPRNVLEKEIIKTPSKKSRIIDKETRISKAEDIMTFHDLDEKQGEIWILVESKDGSSWAKLSFIKSLPKLASKHKRKIYRMMKKFNSIKENKEAEKKSQ